MPIHLIDTHAHLEGAVFAADLAQVLERARAAGVGQVVTIATTAQTSWKEIELAAKHSMLFATVGIQPNHVAEAGPGDWDEVVRLVAQPKVVALGETGLDRHWSHTPFPEQEDYFARHLELARKHELPVVIHCREAEAEVVRMLREDFKRHGPVRGVMHSFTGDLETAEACLEMGLLLSFAGMVTYKNADSLRQVAGRVPLDRLRVETDSPYLAPVPLRGKVKRNEPGHVVHTADCLARIRQVSLDALAQQTTHNTRTLFRLPEPA